MVATDIVPVDDGADEAVPAGDEQRHATRSGLPRGAAELVDVVARLPAEELGQVVLVLVQAGAPPGARLARPAAQVRLAVDSQTAYRGGSMLAWEWNPTRQPSRSSPAATVTTTMALSMAATRSSKARSGTALIVGNGGCTTNARRVAVPCSPPWGMRSSSAIDITRRQLLVGSGAALVAFMAGCSGDDAGGGGDHHHRRGEHARPAPRPT